MKRLTQERFEEPSDLEAGQDESLVIHQRSEPTSNRSLIIFVHGLGGSAYSPKSTWGHFPRFVFEDLPDLDVGLYSYRTLLKRMKFWKSIKLNDEATIFAEIIRDGLAEYETIILVGHSMGGLLCKGAIASLITSGTRDALVRIGGLFLMASPQLGALRVPGALSWISPDFRALKPHGEFVATIDQTFENELYLDEEMAAVDKMIIPTWVVMGASDFWVDKLSAGIGLSARRKKTVHGSHTEIVKPSSKSQDSYVWVKNRIKICLVRYEYDVFLASPMAALETDDDYKRYREGALRIEKALKETIGFTSVYYAGRDITTRANFDAHDVSLAEDFGALKRSRHFMLVYPEKSPSSVIFEAGLALALGKSSIYVVRDRKDLPFLLQKAAQAFDKVRVKIYDGCATTDKVVKLIENNGKKLFFK